MCIYYRKMLKEVGISTLDDFDSKNKRVLLRLDLNSPVVNGKITPLSRIKESLETIKELQRKKASVVIFAHQGRPGDDEFISLRQHAKLLNRYIKIKFVPDIIGEKAITAIKNIKPCEIILLENVRFLKEEFRPFPINKNRFVKNLSPLFDLFVLDAFSVCHRNETSVVAFPRILNACAGRLLEKELRNLDRIKDMGAILYILGGAKISENLALMQESLRKGKARRILVAGLLGQLCLIASGKDLGSQNKFLKKKNLIKFVPALRKLLKKYKSKIENPVDLAIKPNGKRKGRKELGLAEFPRNEEIFDIGSKTITRYVGIIKKEKKIFLKGPLSYYFERQFRKGTREILKAIPNKAFSVLGGGDTNEAIRLCGVNKKKFNYVSLAGGALSQYLAGKNLPGLEALKKARKKRKREDV